jgi:hypothetical protein
MQDRRIDSKQCEDAHRWLHRSITQSKTDAKGSEDRRTPCKQSIDPLSAARNVCACTTSHVYENAAKASRNLDSNGGKEDGDRSTLAHAQLRMSTMQTRAQEEVLRQSVEIQQLERALSRERRESAEREDYLERRSWGICLIYNKIVEEAEERAKEAEQKVEEAELEHVERGVIEKQATVAKLIVALDNEKSNNNNSKKTRKYIGGSQI